MDTNVVRAAASAARGRELRRQVLRNAWDFFVIWLAFQVITVSSLVLTDFAGLTQWMWHAEAGGHPRADSVVARIVLLAGWELIMWGIGLVFFAIGAALGTFYYRDVENSLVQATLFLARAPVGESLVRNGRLRVIATLVLLAVAGVGCVVVGAWLVL